MTELAGLHPTLAHHLVSTLGWTELRPLQQAAIAPVVAGQDALLLAPTAGGKTEAAAFPVLSRMAAEGWTGLSVLYLCPLKALLNNLLPRLETYGGWTGRRVALWHGDTAGSRRRAILAGPPDLLLTTPESLESMLVSANVDHRRLFADLQAVIVDEVHAFGSGDRGLASARRPRTADPDLRAAAAADRAVRHRRQPGRAARAGCRGPRSGSAPARSSPPRRRTSPARSVTIRQTRYLTFSWTTSGPWRTPPRSSRRCTGERSAWSSATPSGSWSCSARELRARGVTTHLVHASLSLDERRRAEQAFAEGRDCVIVSTSALELGVDVGDLDRVIQVNSPPTVAGFLQRLGRSGRRPGTTQELPVPGPERGRAAARRRAAAGLEPRLRRAGRTAAGAPAHRRPAAARALCLQEKRIGEQLWQDWLSLPDLTVSARPITSYLIEQGFVDREDGMLFIGPEAERRFGHRHFMGLMAVFTAPPEFTVLHGRNEIGRVDPVLLADWVEGPRLLLLGGRSWRVTWTDWKRRRCFVEPAESGGRARWLSSTPGGISYELARAMRDVLLGADPPVTLTRRAAGVLAGLRSDAIGRVAAGGTVISGSDDDLRWWTWAGYRANATLKATLGGLADESQRVDDLSIRLRADLRPQTWSAAVKELRDQLCLPEIDDKALSGLKFSDALPRPLAVATLATRLADLDHAAAVLAESIRFER